MSDQLSVFDYLSKNGNFPLGKSVADSLDRIEPLLSRYLSIGQFETLSAFRNAAADNDVRIPSRRSDVHPLNSDAATSPVYTSLAQHDVNNTLAAYTRKLTRLPQALLVLEYFDAITLKQSDITAISDFCRRVSKTSNTTAAHLASCIPEGQSLKEFVSAIEGLTSLKSQNVFTRSEQARLAEYLRALTLWMHLLETRDQPAKPAAPTSAKPNNAAPTVRPQIVEALNPPPNDEDDEDDDDADRKGKPRQTRYRQIRDDPTEASETHDAVAAQSLIAGQDDSGTQRLKALARHGHYTRLNKTYAGSSDESLSTPQTELALEFLLGLHPTSDAEKIAALVWKLVAITGHHFDDLFSCLIGEKLKASKTLEAIFRSGSEIHWVAHHLIGDRLPQNAGQDETQGTFTLKARLPASECDDRAWQLVTKMSPTTTAIDTVLSAKEAIRKAARGQPGLKNFTEARLRGSLIQAVFYLDYDLPQTQLMFGEQIQHSAAALHYVAWDQRVLQNALNLGLYRLYGDRLPRLGIDSERVIVGAPKANTGEGIFQQSRDWFNECQEAVQQPLRNINREEKHNTFAQTAMHLLGVSSGHRQTNDLRMLRLGDLYLDKGLVLYRDKPSDSAVYRRLACMPTQAAIYLRKYLHHLRVLLDQAKRNVLTTIKKRCQEALEDRGPIFFLIQENECSEIEPPHELLTPYGLSRDECNVARHLQSTQLRMRGASPLLVEAHLGHLVGGPLFSNTGFISAEEFADELRPHLDRWLDSLGYRPAKHTTLEVRKFDHSGFDFKAMAAEEHKDDTSLFRSQARKQISESLPVQERKELIHAVIAKVVPEYSAEKPPRNITLTNDQIQTIRNLVGAADYTNLVNLQRTFRRLVKLLEKYRTEYKWTFDRPPTMVLDAKQPLSITRGHLAAASFCNDIKKELVESARHNPAFDDHQAFLKSLLLWGQAKNLEQARVIAESIKAERYIVVGLAYVVNLRGDMKDSSRSVGGIPALFATRWIAAGCPRTTRKVERHLKEIHPQFELACEYAQKVYMPLTLADVASDTIEHKEAHPNDIRRITLDTLGKAHTPIGWEDKKQTERKGVTSSRSEDEKQFKQLKLAVKKPDKQSFSVGSGPAKKRRAIQSVENFRSTAGHSTLINLFADWAIKLLGPTANKRSGKKLTEETVAKYLHQAWVPLSTVLEGGSISQFGDEELYELLLSALEFDPARSEASGSTADLPDEDDEASIDQARALNRLFDEMSGRYALPSFRFRGVGDSKSNIDAGFVTNAEQRFIEDTLSEWSNDPQLTADLKKPIRQLSMLSTLYKQTGLRRNEGLHLQENDLATSNNITSFQVRWHKAKGIKTKASNRYLTLDNALPVRGTATTDKIFDGVHRIPNQNRLLALLGSTIQTVTGSAHGRIHHYRHSKGTEAIFEGFTLRCPIERIRYLSSMVADLGHANIRTTLGFYSHMSHYTIAIRQANEVDELANYQIAGILNKTDNAINVLRSRYSADQPLLAGIIRRSKRPPTKPLKCISLPDALKPTSNESNLDRLMWLYHFGNGESAQQAAATNNITLEALGRLLATTDLVARKLKWSPIDAGRLQSEMHSLIEDDSMYQTRTANHSVFPGDEFLPLISGVSLTKELAETTKAAAAGLTLRANSALTWVLSDSELSGLQSCWERNGLKLSLQPTGIQNEYHVEPISVPTAKHSTNCIRLVLFCIFLSTEF